MGRLYKTLKEYEDFMLASPIAGQVSGEHDPHKPDEEGFIPQAAGITHNCICDRCRIIRIKRRRAFRFPRIKCLICRELFVSAFHKLCPDCREEPNDTL